MIIRRLLFPIAISMFLSLAALANSWFEADSLMIIAGTLGSGGVSDTYQNDCQRLVINETTGSPCLELDFSFSDVPTSANTIMFNGYYDGNAAHNVKVQMWNYATGVWDNLTADTTDIPSTSDDIDRDYTWSFGSDYISSTNALVKINHVSNGADGYYLSIDQIVLAPQTIDNSDQTGGTIDYTALPSGTLAVEYSYTFGELAILRSIWALIAIALVGLVYDMLYRTWWRWSDKDE